MTKRATDDEKRARGTFRDDRADPETVAKPRVRRVASPERTPMPKTPAEWRSLVCALPGFDPHLLGAGCEFDPMAAAHAINWIETNVTHLKGAKYGQFFRLEQWQRAVVANLFGWKRADGTRRFRECLIYVAKKAGKSALVMALTLYLFLEDEEGGPEVYCAAAKREQARIIWDQCKTQIARIDPTEQRAERFQHSIVKADGGFLKPISADAGTEDGMNPHAAIVDELHRQPDGRLVEVIRLSKVARSQPMVIYLTTADEDRESVCNDIHRRAVAIRDNPGDPMKPGYDPEFLPAIFEADPSDDWTKPETWRKANPSLGVTVPEEEVAKECRRAQENPTLEPGFKRYYLNLRGRAEGKGFDMEAWDRCPRVTAEELRGRSCVVGIDLSATTDIEAMLRVFDDGPTVSVLSTFWVPEEAARKRSVRNDPLYRRWHDAGFLTLTEGDQIDDERIMDEVLDLVAPYSVAEVAIDPWNSVRYTQPLMRRGFNVVTVRQGSVTRNEPIKYLGVLLGRGLLRHDGNPVLRWMMANARIVEDRKGNQDIVRGGEAEKIDGAAALLTALARKIAQPEPDAGPEAFLLPAPG